ncbi:MAG: Trm112 family protein [Patescibacteria group bacterium]|nr:Trm112 family protein [Patescibacteria group bacterium]
MLDARLLKMLVCPENRTPLKPADAELLGSVNRAIAAGQVHNRAGQAVTHRLEAGLVREDRTLLYPIVDGIPSLLVDEAIPLESLEASSNA